MNNSITRERLEALANAEYCKSNPGAWLLGLKEVNELARMALAAMDSEPVEMPLDYLQGHKDGLEWAARLAEANHPETGDWLYDDPIELSKAIRKGPDMPPVQPVADSEPVAWLLSGGGAKNVVCFDSGNAYADPLREVTPLYRHAQQPVVEREPIAWLNDAYLARGVVDGEAGSEDAGPGYIPVYREAGPHPAPVVPDERDKAVDADDHPLLWSFNAGWNACRAAMLAAAQQSPGSEPATVPGKWIPVSERMPENDGAYLCWDNRYVTTYAFIFGAWQANQFIAKNITHWMPLPAGPKEVQGE